MTRRLWALSFALTSLAGLVGLAAPASAVKAAATATALTGEHRALAGGRSYWLSGADVGTRLVIGLPGTALGAQNTNDAFWSATGGWQAHAAAHGYTLALGESSGGRWNVGAGWPGGTQDDMSYLLALVDDATTAHGGPYTEVYVAGFSAGGAMAWRAAADRPDVFAACGMASGWAPYIPTHRMDCWHVHGTGDTTVPIRGGLGTMDYTFPPAFYEESKISRDSQTVLEPTSGGHGVAGWMADRLWTYWTTGRTI